MMEIYRLIWSIWLKLWYKYMKSHTNIYKFKSYKRYLTAVEEELSIHQRGFRSRLSEALGVQNAYISKVLNQAKFDFTLEQTMKVAQFLELKEDDKTYLVWLVEWNRAGTKELKEFCAGHIERAQNQYLDIKNRVGEAKVISEAHQNRFYSHWLYMAAHVISSVPSYNSIEKMAAALRVEPSILREIFVFLTECGLVVPKGNAYTVGETVIHLQKNSPHTAKNQTNWRLKAIDDIADPNSTGIHYSSLSSLSHSDWDQMRHDLTEVIQKYVELIRPSAEETVCCFNLDFFKIVKS